MITHHHNCYSIEDNFDALEQLPRGTTRVRLSDFTPYDAGLAPDDIAAYVAAREEQKEIQQRSPCGRPPRGILAPRTS